MHKANLRCIFSVLVSSPSLQKRANKFSFDKIIWQMLKATPLYPPTFIFRYYNAIVGLMMTFSVRSYRIWDLQHWGCISYCRPFYRTYSIVDLFTNFIDTAAVPIDAKSKISLKKQASTVSVKTWGRTFVSVVERAHSKRNIHNSNPS